MSLYSKQKLFCRACGKEFETDFVSYHGEVCGRRCYQELDWKRFLSTIGKEYYVDTRQFKCICGEIAEEGSDYCTKCQLSLKANKVEWGGKK